jgi:hypothetical protein
LPKKILYTIAKDKQGQFITAKLAEKELDYYCLHCNSEMVLRKSEKTGRNSKRAHFSHKTLTPNCTPETVLHYSFKSLLAEKIQKHIDLGISLPFSWLCSECEEIHNGDLIKKLKTVIVEYDMAIVKPNIALLDEANKVIIVIEVIVTHKPEEKTIQFYKDNNIIVIEIVLSSNEDLDNIDKKIGEPDKVGACRNPKCSTHKTGMHRTMITIAESFCWKCEAPMKLAFYQMAGSTFGPGTFDQKELEFARSKGVVIKEQYSRTANERYLANTCPKCGSFIGDHYLFSDYAAPADFGEIPSNKYEIGFHCEKCIEAEMWRSEE